MIPLLWRLSVRLNLILQQVAPSNILMRWMRRRENLRWGIPVSAAGVAVYGTAVFWSGTLMREPDLGWLAIPFFTFLWSAMKLLAFGPITVILLTVARWREASLIRTTVGSQSEALEVER